MNHLSKQTMKLALCLFSMLSIVPLSSFAAEHTTPVDFLARQDNQGWMAYRVEAQPDTASMCCWQSHNSKKAKCDLVDTDHGYGHRGDDQVTEYLTIYAKIDDHEVSRLLTVGDHCEVESHEQNITWLSSVSQQDSIAWLMLLANNASEQAASGALHALAWHQSDQASAELFQMALSQPLERARDAMFWLGEARHDGHGFLNSLYERLPTDESKRQLNFALSLSDDAKSLALLKHIAQSDDDPEQRADALFWLAENQSEAVLPMLLTTIKRDKSETVRKKAIFSLSQIKTPSGINALANIARNSDWLQNRTEALFWLSQVSPDETKSVVFEWLQGQHNEELVNQAIFALQQLGKNDNDEALFDVLDGDYSQQAKKQALFWLTQSENKRTIKRLQAML